VGRCKPLPPWQKVRSQLQFDLGVTLDDNVNDFLEKRVFYEKSLEYNRMRQSKS